jgi:predicted peptidase
VKSKLRLRLETLTILVALIITGCTGTSQQTTQITPQPGQHAYTYEMSGVNLNYLLFLPQSYGKDLRQQWPLMIFLHGLAKRGDTIEALEELKKDGPPMIVEERPDFPFIVLSPQCPSDSYWEGQLNQVDKLVDEVVHNYAVDTNRIYLTGLSMGGYGSWHYALSEPEQFAAIVPIAGGHIPQSDEVPDNICDLKYTPTRVFHGNQDDVVLPRQSEVLVEALEACGSDVRFTLYPDADHDDSWKHAYSDPELYEWLLEQALK